MLLISNVEPPIGENISNIILQSWLRVVIHELFLVSTHYLLLLPIVALMVPIDTFSLIIFSLLPPFRFHRHLGIDLYKLCNSGNYSQFPQQGNSYCSRDKQHSQCTPLFLSYQLTLTAWKKIICIKQRK